MDGDDVASAPETGTLDETRLDSIDEAIDRIELPPGSTVHRYAVLSTLGSGATGVVYAAYDPELDRKIAIKVLHRLPADGTRDGDREQLQESRRVRMLREAQALARLRHPNVVTVHDVGRIDDQLFIAMEHVEGATLGRWARARERSVDEVVAVYAMAGRGLAAAHADGLVHRDFKPEKSSCLETGRESATRALRGHCSACLLQWRDLLRTGNRKRGTPSSPWHEE